jgi:hypothetical protein
VGVIRNWIDSILQNPNTSIMGGTQIAMAFVIAYEIYSGSVSLGAGLPIAATSFAGGIGNLLAGDAGKKWRKKNFSKEPAGECSGCASCFELIGRSVCNIRGHQVNDKDTCDKWTPIIEIHISDPEDH